MEIERRRVPLALKLTRFEVPDTVFAGDTSAEGYRQVKELLRSLLGPRHHGLVIWIDEETRVHVAIPSMTPRTSLEISGAPDLYYLIHSFCQSVGGNNNVLGNLSSPYCRDHISNAISPAPEIGS